MHPLSEHMRATMHILFLGTLSRGAVRSAASSYMQQCVWWLAPRARYSVRMTYRPSAALRAAREP